MSSSNGGGGSSGRIPLNSVSKFQLPSIQAVVRPQVSSVSRAVKTQHPSNGHDFIHENRDRPVGLDVDEFLPRHLQPGLGAADTRTTDHVTELKALNSIASGHKNFTLVMSYRRKNLNMALSIWSMKGSRAALELATQRTEDLSLLVDILGVMVLKPSLWSLDSCMLILPTIAPLLAIRYESYVTVGCLALKLMLKTFGPIIKRNISAPPGIGVDLSGEERYNKCMSCYNELLSLRPLIAKRQSSGGKLGTHFKEISILMQTID